MDDYSYSRKEIMDRNRVLELAVEELERQKEVILAEIEAIRSELKGTPSRTPKTSKAVGARTKRKRTKTAAARKAQSQKMKRYWAAKRAGKAKSSKAAKPATKAKARTKTMAEKRALSLKMKEVWKKRKMQAAKKKKK